MDAKSCFQLNLASIELKIALKIFKTKIRWTKFTHLKIANPIYH